MEKNLNDDLVHYWDLLPFINVTRVINHLALLMPQVPTVTVNHLLQPSVVMTHTILLLLFNFMLFNEQQLNSIAEDENALFNLANMVSVVIFKTPIGWSQTKKSLIQAMSTRAAELRPLSRTHKTRIKLQKLISWTGPIGIRTRDLLQGQQCKPLNHQGHHSTFIFNVWTLLLSKF